jgi:hypothetical protein
MLHLVSSKNNTQQALGFMADGERDILSVTELYNTPCGSSKREKCNAREMVIWNKINNVHQIQPILC